MSIKKVSKEQPDNFKFTDENLKAAEKAILNYPKGNDLIWNKSTKEGKKQLEGMPHIDSNMTEYNTRNVNAHNKDIGTLESFF